MIAQAWNRAVARWYFRPEMQGRDVYLSVDDDALEAIGETYGVARESAVSDFESAIQAMTAQGSDPFTWWRGQRTTWCNGDGLEPPPFVALLAACVLAANRMVVESGVGAPNYYNRFTEIVGASDSWDHGKYRTLIPEMWGDLAWWLDVRHNAALGRSTAWTYEHWWQYTGYSLSQALLRGADRERLSWFFDDLGLKPGTRMEPRELLARLKEWARKGNHLADRLKAMLDDGELAPRIGEMVASELEDWDGSIRDVSGVRWLRISLTVDLKLGGLGLAVRVPDDDRGAEIVVAGKHVATDEVASFANIEETADEQVLVEGLKVSGSASTRYRYEPRLVVPFVIDDDLGRWRSISRAQLGETHCVLLKASLLSQAENQLKAMNAGFKRTMKVRIPEGWVLLKGVTPRAGIANTGHPALDALIPAPSELPALVGGLRLESMKRIYLMGGAPDLSVPGLGTELLQVNLDGKSLPPVGPEGRLIPLQDVQLGAGEHNLQVGSTPISFHLLPQMLEQRLLPAILGHMLLRAGKHYLATGPPKPVDGVARECDLMISGAALEFRDTSESNAAPAVMIKAATRGYTGLGQPGQLLHFEVAQPAWARDAGLAFNGFEVEPYERRAKFPFLFVVRRFASWCGIVALQARRQVALLEKDPNDAQVGAWAQEVANIEAAMPRSEDDETAQRWSAYVALASGVGE